MPLIEEIHDPEPQQINTAVNPAQGTEERMNENVAPIIDAIDIILGDKLDSNAGGDTDRPAEHKQILIEEIHESNDTENNEKIEKHPEKG